MIPRFERSGQLPPGLHEADWDEIAVRFGEKSPGENPRRARLLLGLARALLALAEAGCGRAYLDGSFVSREKWPRDFDVCYEPQDIREDELEDWMLGLNEGRKIQKQRWGGEVMPRDFPFDWSGVSVFQMFQRTRIEGERKGMIAIDLPANRETLRRWIREEEEKNALHHSP